MGTRGTILAGESIKHAMSHTDILVIGAGAAGLMAARTLLRAGRTVRLLEGRDRTGGRIHTLADPRFPRPLEAGAEFIHGTLPHTIGLLDGYGLSREPLRGAYWISRDGGMHPSEEFIDGADVLEKALRDLPHDMPLREFLDTYLYAPEHRRLRTDVERFAEGYDAADPARAGTLAFREEWLSSDPQEQFRPAAGYTALTDAMTQECRNLGADVRLRAVAKTVRWKPGHVEVHTADGEAYTAARLLVTVPLGVWQAEPEDEAFIAYEPALPQKTAAARLMGFGHVYKITLVFDDAFWNHTAQPGLDGNLGFLFADGHIPTWWTRDTGDVPMLTGWLGGPAAARLSGAGDETLLEYALATLGGIFRTGAGLPSRLAAYHVSRWGTDPFSLGAYSYAVVGGDDYKAVLARPVENTLYFAGEALADGGTVEAALDSGLRAAREMT